MPGLELQVRREKAIPPETHWHRKCIPASASPPPHQDNRSRVKVTVEYSCGICKTQALRCSAKGKPKAEWS